MNDARLRDDQWKGQPAIIVGGGPSLENLDWSLLHGRKNVIVINRAFLQVPTAAIWFSEDLRVVELYGKRPEWTGFKGLKIFHGLTPTFGRQAIDIDPSIYLVERKRQDKYWSESLEDGLAISSNSGVGAINLACLLDADPILLLGFDCRAKKGDVNNYHEDYRENGFDLVGQGQFDSYRSDFEHWVAPQLRGRRVLNLIDKEFPSAIECWPRWERESTLRTGRPSMIITKFQREQEIRFDYLEEQSQKFEIDLKTTGQFLPISQVLGGGQEASPT